MFCSGKSKLIRRNLKIQKSLGLKNMTGTYTEVICILCQQSPNCGLLCCEKVFSAWHATFCSVPQPFIFLAYLLRNLRWTTAFTLTCLSRLSVPLGRLFPDAVSVLMSIYRIYCENAALKETLILKTDEIKTLKSENERK